MIVQIDTVEIRNVSGFSGRVWSKFMATNKQVYWLLGFREPAITCGMLLDIQVIPKKKMRTFEHFNIKDFPDGELLIEEVDG